jgi:alpha-D-xyloside xylohydrolase
MPYIYAQAQLSSARGWPMLRTLFFEFPDDPTTWLVEDEYMFGADLLVAPLFSDDATARGVYLPPGNWIDYQTNHVYAGARWQRIPAYGIPIVLLVREGAVIPHVAVAQSTGAIDWTKLELRMFGSGNAAGVASVALPDEPARTVRIESGRVIADSLRGHISWRVTHAP